MGDTSTIEWTEATWNPVVGCQVASPGCDNCYAARQAAGRLASTPAYKGLSVRNAEGVPTFTGEVRCLPERLDQPLRWRTPRRIFVNSMSDLFHPAVPRDFIAEVFAVMASASRHTFQVLTKRPQRMARLLDWKLFEQTMLFYRGERARPPYNDLPWPLPNVWLGTSIESDRYTFRADHVRATLAAVRFLSLEPLLGPLPSLDLTGIDWVIVGGESGPRARPMHPQWVRDIRDRCVTAGVPFFFKQWGEWRPLDRDDWLRIPQDQRPKFLQPLGHINLDGTWHDDKNPGPAYAGAVVIARDGKKGAGRTLDGRTWDEYPA